MITGKEGTKSQGGTAIAQHVSNGSVGYTSPAQLAAKEPDMSEEPLAFGDYNAGLFSPKQFSAQPPVPPTDETQTNAGTVQRKFAPVQRKENKTGLPDQLKSGMEGLSGLSLDDVQVHYNSSEPAQLQAHAFAQGTSIHIAPGQEKQLPHEAWHVVQQKQGRVKPNVQLKGINVNTETSLEQEADLMGAKAVAAGNTTQLQAGEITAWNKTAVAQRKINAPVVQRSAKYDDNGVTDVANARAAMDLAHRLIRGEIGPMEGVEENNQPVLRGQVATRRRSLRIEIDQDDGNGYQVYYILPGQRGALHQQAEANHWNYRYRFEDVDFMGQFIVPNVEMGNAEVQQHTVQRVATVTGGPINPAAAKAGGAALPVIANGTLSFIGVTANNASTGATGTSLNRQPSGTGVGATRPTNWTQFIALAGGANPFKQGHQMHQDLGGDGTHDNLAPFTSSLNGLHYTRVEQHVLGQTNPPPSTDQYADYSCIPVYGGNAGILAWANAGFAAMTGINQLAAMVVAGIITAPAAAAIVAAAVAPVVPAPTAAQLLLVNAWFTAYIPATFPTSINCTVNFIDYAPGGGMVAPAATATGNQVVNITNDF